jgi:hypothetical protein
VWGYLYVNQEIGSINQSAFSQSFQDIFNLIPLSLGHVDCVPLPLVCRINWTSTAAEEAQLRVTIGRAALYLPPSLLPFSKAIKEKTAQVIPIDRGMTTRSHGIREKNFRSLQNVPTRGKLDFQNLSVSNPHTMIKQSWQSSLDFLGRLGPVKQQTP